VKEYTVSSGVPTNKNVANEERKMHNCGTAGYDKKKNTLITSNTTAWWFTSALPALSSHIFVTRNTVRSCDPLPAAAGAERAAL
jgi:hypothetical protein